MLKDIVIKDDDNANTKAIDTENTRQESLVSFCKKYIQVYQKIFDLAPLFSYLSEDPYIEQKQDMQLLLN